MAACIFSSLCHDCGVCAIARVYSERSEVYVVSKPDPPSAGLGVIKITSMRHGRVWKLARFSCALEECA